MTATTAAQRKAVRIVSYMGVWDVNPVNTKAGVVILCLDHVKTVKRAMDRTDLTVQAETPVNVSIHSLLVRMTRFA